MKFTKEIKKYISKGSLVKLIVLLIILMGLLATIVIVKKAVKLKPEAQVATVSINTTPSRVTLPPNATVRLNLNAGSEQIGFVRVVLSFNRAHINLTGEISTTSRLDQSREPATDPWITKTTMAEANSSGRIVLVLALDEADRANAPTGTFEIANFPVRAVSVQQNLSTQLNITVAESQIVNMNTQALNITSAGTTFTLNPAITNTPTNTLTNTPTNSPTNTPTSTITNTPTTAPRPDLQVVSIVGSVGAVPNSYNLRTIIRNNGPAAVLSGTNITLHGGFCNTAGCSVSNSAMQLINTRTTGLIANSTYEFTQTLNNLNFGNLNYRANVDFGNSIVEANEANNNGTISLAIPTFTSTPTNTPTGITSTTVTASPTTDCSFPGDTNCDQSVDILDYSILFASFGKKPGDSGYDSRANLNHDSQGNVDILDYSVLFYNFGNRRG